MQSMAIRPFRTAPPRRRSPARFVRAMQDMKVGSVWMQLFSRSGPLDHGTGGTSELIAALKATDIKVAGWGYCQGTQTNAALDNAKTLCGKYGIDAFVADIEPGNTVDGAVDKWDPKLFGEFMSELKQNFGQDNLGLSTFARLDLHPDARDIVKLAPPYVGVFAPQIYWNGRSPVSFAQASLKSFRDAGIQTPLVATTQSYWDRTNASHPETPKRATVEKKLAGFLRDFRDADFAKVIGLNWYHAGKHNTEKEGGMSDAMISSIILARLDTKPYQPA
jgi:hypothetical protein